MVSMNYLLLMNNTDLDNLVKNPSELAKKVCDLINKSQAGTYYLSAGGGGGRGAEGPHGQVDEGAMEFLCKILSAPIRSRKVMKHYK